MVNDGVNGWDLLGLVDDRSVPCCDEEAILGEGLKRSLEASELTKNDSVPPDASKLLAPPRREYCGLICCNKKNKAIISTEPTQGGRILTGDDLEGGKVYTANTCNPFLNGNCTEIFGEDWETVSAYHSQPTQSTFSQSDWNFVIGSGKLPLFLGTPDGEVYIIGQRGHRRMKLPEGGSIQKPAPIVYPVNPHPTYPNGGILGDGKSPLDIH